MKCRYEKRMAAISVLAFSAGVLLSLFLPPVALTVLLGAALVWAGILALLR